MRPVRYALQRLASAMLAIMLAIPAISPQPVYAAASFTGGPFSDSAMVIPNDHTPIAIRFWGTGLKPNTEFTLKVRLSPQPTPQNVQNRGWTWNAATGKWVQEREQDRTQFPVVRSDAAGNITEQWAHFKFGDEGKSGTYYILVSLNAQKGETYNCDPPLGVNVIDMKTAGARVHNGVVTGVASNQRVEAVMSGAPVVLGLARSERNGVDDDCDGVVDNENLGPAGATGDYGLPVPLSTAFNVVAGGSTTLASAVSLSKPDEDIALGASDQTAPSAPSGLSAAAADGKVTLNWSKSSDNVGVTRYRVYRWAVPALGVPYSPPKQLMTTTSSLTYVDTSITTADITYSYEVRAVDAATNVSARSNTATIVSVASPPKPKLATTPSKADGSGGWFRAAAPKITLSTDRGTLFYSWNSSSSGFEEYESPLAAPQGSRTLYYYAVDDAGNESDIMSRVIKTDTRKPKASLVAPAISTRPSATRSFPVSWSATDTASSSGGLRYDVEYQASAGAKWKRLKSATSSIAATLTPPAGATYRFRVRARDAAGNVSSWTATKMTVVPFDDAAASYRGRWATTTSAEAFMGKQRATTAKGATATFTFSGGSAAYLIVGKGPSSGSVTVYLDGRKLRTYSLYAAEKSHRNEISLGRISGTRKHTIKVVAATTSGRSLVEIDGLAVRR